MRILDSIEKDWQKKKAPHVQVGDQVDVHVKIIEGEKERIQIFSGTVIAMRHQGLSQTFTVRRIVQGEGVERIFPLHSPRVDHVVVKKHGKVRRAKLHYLRERVGRATKVEERGSVERGGEVEAPEVVAAPAPAPAPAAETKSEQEPAKS